MSVARVHVLQFASIKLSALIPLQAYWYHRGELNPKFKTLLYYNLVIITLLCIVSVLYFYDTAVWTSYRNKVVCNETVCLFYS